MQHTKAKLVRSSLNDRHYELVQGCVCWVFQESELCCRGEQFVKHLKSLARRWQSKVEYARDVAAGFVQTGDKAVLDRVASN